jgi:hypothetical protein
MKIDNREKIRKFFNMQYVKIKRTAAVGSLIILTLNLSFSIYPFISHRGIHPYVAIPLLFSIVIIVIWIAADFYVKRLEMYRTESLAERILNPYAIYAIGPFEEMKYRHMEIPIMEAISKMMPEGKEKNIFDTQLDKVKTWCNLGYIPRKDFPNHLKKYYISKTENRL